MCRLSFCFFFFSSRRRHTRCSRDWSSDVCSSDLVGHPGARRALVLHDQSLAGAAAVSDTTRSWTYGTLAPADLPRLDTLIEEGMADGALGIDRKSTRLNSSHGYISYAVFCLKKKNRQAATDADRDNELHQS